MQQLTIEIDHKVRTAAASIGASAFDLHSCAVQLYDTDMQMGHFFFTRPSPNHQLTDPTHRTSSPAHKNFFYSQAGPENCTPNLGPMPVIVAIWQILTDFQTSFTARFSNKFAALKVVIMVT